MVSKGAVPCQIPERRRPVCVVHIVPGLQEALVTRATPAPSSCIAALSSKHAHHIMHGMLYLMERVRRMER